MAHKIHYYSADGTGIDSVYDIVAKNKDRVTATEVSSYQQWDEITQKLLTTIEPGDVVILDTITMFAEMIRTDLKIGSDPEKLLWAMKDKFFDHKSTWDYYDAATNLIMRKLKNFRSRGARVIVTAHERTDEDLTATPPIKRRVPDVNQKLATSLIASSSVVGRLRVIYENEYKGEELLRKKGQRVLEMGQSLEYVGKIHAPLDVAMKLKTTIDRPSLTKLYNMLGFEPSFITLYGPPGSGKSTFVLSDLVDLDGKGLGK
jgi:hypothetical protein